jgi:hypothetical protein
MTTDTGTANQEPKQRVFISYSRKDIKFARRLAGDLEKTGFDVWWDISDLKGGDDWVRFIPAAIETSQYFVVLLSPDSVKSEWVAKEYTYAIVKRKKIVPAMVRPSAVPFALNTINYVNFTTDDYETGLNNLLIALGSTPQVVPPGTGVKKLFNKLPLVFTRNPYLSIGGVLILFLILIFALLNPFAPVTPPPDGPTITPTVTPRPGAPDTATFTPTQTSTATISPTPTITRTRTPIPVNFVLPTVCVQPIFDIHSVNVRTGPGTGQGVLTDAPALEVGKCPLIGGQNEENTWFMIAYDQPDPEFRLYEGGWIRKDLFDLSIPVFVPNITLTPTPTITLSPTITSTFTVTSTPTPTSTFTNTPTPTTTNTPTHTPTSTFTPTRTPTPTHTSTPTLEPTVTP